MPKAPPQAAYQSPATRRPSLDNPRVLRTRARILAVARDLLPQVGPTGLTYSLLAERADVTRQTLYRHWPTRAALLCDLILEGPITDYPSPDADPLSVATAWLTSLRAGMADDATRTAVAAVSAEADYDPDSAQALQRIATDRLAAFNELLESSGLAITADQYTLLVGPLLTRIFFDRNEASDEFIRNVAGQWHAAVVG